MIDISFLTSNVVIFSALAFTVGILSAMAYFRLSTMDTRRRDYRADDAIVEAVVAEYTRRLTDYDRLLADLRMRMDVLEMRSHGKTKVDDLEASIEASFPSRPSHAVRNHASRVMGNVDITQHAHEGEESQGQNGTSDYILKLLAEKPRTSREVQQAIGRTREHTARLMKKLHDSGLVSRNTAEKPFTYVLTDLGLGRLRQKAEVAPGLRLT